MHAATHEVEIWSETQTELYYIETDPASASHLHEKPQGACLCRGKINIWTLQGTMRQTWHTYFIQREFTKAGLLVSRSLDPQKSGVGVIWL